MKIHHWIANAIEKQIPRRLCITRLRPNAGRTLLLTFDDGPHPEVTLAVLDRLQQFGVKAIFFIVGNRVQRAPEMLGRILNEGHWLGNHTYSHPNDRRIPFCEYLEELRKCQKLIFDHTGVRPLFHRPPHGQLTTASLLAPMKCGLVTINWSRSAGDWCHQSNADAVSAAEKMISEVRALDIVLFHDRWLHTTVTLDRFLPALHDREFNLKCSIDNIM